MKIIFLTDKEWSALNHIIGNGWANGDFAGYAGEHVQTQKRAMKKFNAPCNYISEAKNKIMLMEHKNMIKGGSK